MKRDSLEVLKELQKNQLLFEELIRQDETEEREEKIYDLIEKIKILQTEYHDETEFSKYLLNTYELVFNIPTSDKNNGFFSGKEFLKCLKTVEKTIKARSHAHVDNIDFSIGTILPGCVYAGGVFLENEENPPQSIEEFEKSKNKLLNTFKAASVVDKSKSPSENIKSFKEKAEIEDDQEAYDTLKALNEIMPKPSATIRKEVNIFISDETGRSEVKIDSDRRKKLTDTKTNLYHQIDSQDEMIVSGILAIIEEHGTNHKLSIKSEEGTHTINHDGNDKIIKQITEKIGTEVSVRKSRMLTNRNRWEFVEWVN